MTSGPVTAAAAGTWQLGDLTVNRMGFGALRLPGAQDRHLSPPNGAGLRRVLAQFTPSRP